MARAPSVGQNHPLAARMALIAFCSQSLCVGSTYGTFGVFMTAVEARFGVTREVSALGMPAVMAALALLAPVAGMLSDRFSLRVLMIIGSLSGAAGYALLAITHSVAVYLLAYAFLIGPNICFAGFVLPAALVNRWYVVNRGRMLGLTNMPLFIGLATMLVAFLLKSHDLPFVYLVLSGILLLNIIPLLFIVDHPPGAAYARGAAASRDGAPPLRGLLGNRLFWFLTIGFATNIAAQTVLGAHLVPMLMGWGMDRVEAATLAGIGALAGIAGTPAMGWLADRIGGRLTMVLMGVDTAILLSLILLRPPTPLLAVLIFLMSFHGAATMSVFAATISEYFGQAAFPRTFGLSKMLTLPFSLLVVPLTATIYVRTGSYTIAMIGLSFCLLAAALLILTGGRGRTVEPAEPIEVPVA